MPAVLLALGACGDQRAVPDARMIDAPEVMIDAPVDANLMPGTLAETGLCLDASCSQISPDVFAYQPHFQLWSDTATKRRWIYLPPGTQIDTTDMDFWKFPVGTKIWKEFTRDSVRVETRLIMRIGSGETNADWYYVPYVWSSTQDATTAEPMGVIDANGTAHDVPSRFQCRTCHDNNKPSRILGFSAIQLDWDNPDTAQLDLADIIAKGWLSTPPTAPAAAGDPYFPLPGTTNEPPALGYLHANCGHCHNPNSNVYTSTPMQLRLTVGTLGSLATTPVYTTAVDQTSTLSAPAKIIAKGDPTNSVMMIRFESTNPTLHMPALGSEMRDPTGDSTLTTWITNIP